MVETNQHFFIKYSDKNMNTGSKYQQPMSFGAHLYTYKNRRLNFRRSKLLFAKLFKRSNVSVANLQNCSGD